MRLSESVNVSILSNAFLVYKNSLHVYSNILDQKLKKNFEAILFFNISPTEKIENNICSSWLWSVSCEFVTCRIYSALTFSVSARYFLNVFTLRELMYNLFKLVWRCNTSTYYSFMYIPFFSFFQEIDNILLGL